MDYFICVSVFDIWLSIHDHEKRKSLYLRLSEKERKKERKGEKEKARERKRKSQEANERER